MTEPLLEVADLSLRFGAVAALRRLSFSIRQGETLALVGESGSGKSATALAILRLIEREGGEIAGGRIRLGGPEPHEITALDDRAMRRVRGRLISMVFQEPMNALNPVLTIGRQLFETIRLHRTEGADTPQRTALEALARVQIGDPEARLRQYPHELSGGLRQRVLIAMALACRPSLLIADEPTTALDVTTQAEILGLIRRLQAESGMAVLFITHDMGVVAEMADRVLVLREGEKVEEAPVDRLFARPQQAYTKLLLSAAPRLGSGSPPAPTAADPVLEVKDLVVAYPVRPHRLWRRAETRAVDGVSLFVGPGETLGLVGESGCGKSTLARAILRLIPIRSGEVRIGGRDVTHLGKRGMFPVRRSVQIIFQDPFAALNPRLPTWDVVSEPAAIHGLVRTEAERRTLAEELLGKVGLGPDHLDRYPHQYSGGQRQRLCIARALSVRPRLIIADEPVAALDVSIAKQVTDLLQQLQRDLGLAFLFVSHDIALVERVSHRIAVMQAGRIVETGTAASLLARPQHPYTRRLLSSVPSQPPRAPDKAPEAATVVPIERALVLDA